MLAMPPNEQVSSRQQLARCQVFCCPKPWLLNVSRKILVLICILNPLATVGTAGLVNLVFSDSFFCKALFGFNLPIMASFKKGINCSSLTRVIIRLFHKFNDSIMVAVRDRKSCYQNSCG